MPYLLTWLIIIIVFAPIVVIILPILLIKDIYVYGGLRKYFLQCYEKVKPECKID